MSNSDSESGFSEDSQMTMCFPDECDPYHSDATRSGLDYNDNDSVEENADVSDHSDVDSEDNDMDVDNDIAHHDNVDYEYNDIDWNILMSCIIISYATLLMSMFHHLSHL